MNDPNGLAYYDGRYRLWAQHSDDAPEYRRIGWGSWSSADMLDWRWDGIAIPYFDRRSAYSGSVVLASDKGLEAWLTLHDHDRDWQTQHRATGENFDLGEPLGPAGRNCRDPFVFRCSTTRDWRMIVAEPCGWGSWKDDAPSSLAVWRSDDRLAWEPAGRIGPWHPRGVMYEVPVLIDFGEVQALLLSLVDRRDDGARCSVRYWLGRFGGAGFECDAKFPAEGVLLDAGPDFYAAIPNLTEGWPDAQRLIVGWASSWATARTMPWPGDVHGGPISLPRVVTLVDGRLCQAPIPVARVPQVTAWSPGKVVSFAISGTRARLAVTVAADGRVMVRREGDDRSLAWTSTDLLALTRATGIAASVDAGLVEIFFLAEGRTITAFVPGAVAVTS